MVSSSLDKSIKKALAKDPSSLGNSNDTGSAVNVNNSGHNNLNLTNNNNNINNTNTGSGSSSGVNFRKDSSLPSDDKIQLLFPKCRPRSDYHHGQLTSQDTLTTDLISIDSSSSNSSQSKLSSNTIIHQQQLQHNSNLNNLTQQASLNSSSKSNNNSIINNNHNLINLNSNNSNNINNINTINNNSKQMKLQSPLLTSPDHNNKKQQHHQYINSEQAKLSKLNNNNNNTTLNNSKHEQNNENNYLETNPFRIGSNNRYFYAQQNQSTDSLLFNTNNNKNSSVMATASSNTASGGYYPSLERHNYFLEPDEIEHNPYMVDIVQSSSMQTQPTTAATTSIPNTIPSSILKTSPPDTPPALQPCTTPVDSSPLGSSRNLWDLSPIKSTTPTRIKTQSPSPTIYSRPHRGSYKKLLASPVPIEEDLETGHYYYNNKKPYYQAPQTDSDSANEPATFNDIHETEKVKPKSSYFSKSKIKHSDTSDVIYAEVRKDRFKDEQRSSSKIVKSKSGSGIMGELNNEKYMC